MKLLMRLTIVILALASFSARAGTVVCSGAIEQVHMHASKMMMIKLSGMNTSVFFCRPDQAWSPAGANQSTSPEMCRTLVSLFMAGKLAGKSVVGMYFDGDEVPADCNSWGNWKSANIRYFQWAD